MFSYAFREELAIFFIQDTMYYSAMYLYLILRIEQFINTGVGC